MGESIGTGYSSGTAQRRRPPQRMNCDIGLLRATEQAVFAFERTFPPSLYVAAVITAQTRPALVAMPRCRLVRRPMQAVDVIVLGAGAAGLFCAGLAGQRGLRVLRLIGPCTEGRRKDSHFRRAGVATSPTVIVRQPTFCPTTRPSAVRRWRAIGQQTHRPVDRYLHRPPRKTSRPIVLRRPQRTDRADAAERMQRGRRAALAALRGSRRAAKQWRFRCGHLSRCDHRTPAGGGHGRAVDSEAGRQRPGLSAGATI